MELLLTVVMLLLSAGCFIALIYYAIVENSIRRNTTKIERHIVDYIRTRVKSRLRSIEDDERIVSYLVAQLLVHTKKMNPEDLKHHLDIAILDFCILLLKDEPLQQAIKSNDPSLKRITSWKSNKH